MPKTFKYIIKHKTIEQIIFEGDSLISANLECANLRGADLRNADLRNANLQYANLQYANLTGAILRGANLRYANLQYANLTGAILRGANLRYANLQDANLRYADFQNANLEDADLRGADLSPHNICPQYGTFIGYKKVSGCVIQLIIPHNAKRTSSLIGRKCRCEFAYVKAILNESGEPSTLKQVTGNWDKKTEYVLGTRVNPDKYCDDIRIECAHGIHFFMTKEEAERW